MNIISQYRDSLIHVSVDFSWVFYNNYFYDTNVCLILPVYSYI